MFPCMILDHDGRFTKTQRSEVASVHHLAPAGVAGFVLANRSMSSNQ